MTGPAPGDDQSVEELTDAHEALEEAARAVLEATAATTEDAAVTEPDENDDALDLAGAGDGLVHSALAELRAIAGTSDGDRDDT
jgi:hypothetical protein